MKTRKELYKILDSLKFNGKIHVPAELQIKAVNNSLVEKDLYGLSDEVCSILKQLSIK